MNELLYSRGTLQSSIVQVMAAQGEHTDSLFQPGQRAQVMQLLRAYTDAHVEMTRHLGATLGVHVNDAVAVSEILWAEATGHPLTPARLAERLGHTSGATATLLNRIETAGLIVRSREDADRRIVRLRLTAAARSRTEEFFIPTGQQVDDVLAGYDDTTLGHLERVLTDVVAVTARRNAHLREALRPGTSSNN
jgi:MarR family transcriptional regulator, organic hydroperoxide resistance regulator